MSKQKNKVVSIIGRVTSDLPLLGFFGLALLFPIAAISSVAWVVVGGTTPDVLPFHSAVGLGILVGVIILAVCVGMALKFSGDSFPDFFTGFILPCVIIIFVSCMIQPIAVKVSQVRLKIKQPSVPAQIQPRARNSTNKPQNKALHPTPYSPFVPHSLSGAGELSR